VRQSGQPLGFGNALFLGDIHDISLPKDQRSPDQWFNTSGFNKVSAQQLANNLQTFPIRFSGIRSDGQATWNFSLIKNYKIRERVGVQFRAEVYNTMNHPSFSTPNTSPTNSSFGTSTAVDSEPRNWQFALKTTF
jgi:outer membrane cobalamin receptor